MRSVCRLADCLRVAEVALTVALRKLAVTTSVKNAAQFFRELQKLVAVCLFLDLFVETFYAFVVRKVHDV